MLKVSSAQRHTTFNALRALTYFYVKNSLQQTEPEPVSARLS